VNGTTHDLDSVTDPRGGVTKFTYDSSHRMTYAQGPREAALHAFDGVTGATKNHYDSSGRVDEQWSPTATSGLSGMNTNPTGFDYSVPGETTITDPEGNVEVQGFTQGFLTSDTRGAGTADEGTWTYSYDPDTGGVAQVTAVDPSWWTRGFH
jgi:hypothetical protein